ncbi:uncharacterized protein LOC130670837 [Microplitis mediator]|uniref:uncharacterized protein LOC130670837 n=1 Tax=Microplitis mediator TaxID=375433 RepID=UPI0025558FB5|nr:uncharacterized protein LOC130670837 [Microplitis mediator]
MLNSVPKQIVLTLQSSPPFLLEIILAITIALLLSIPLITRLQYFLGYVEEPLASFDLYNPRRHIHEPISSSTSGSNESLSRYPLRHVNSSPDIKNSYLNTFTMDINPSYHHSNNSTDYPISVAYDYGYYRHKLIETNLKQHYGNQAPGNVVLNSLHLSSIDSQTDLRLSEKYNHSFFELIPEPADPYQEKRDQLVTIIHPRDHFLRKGARRHESADKSTETLFISNVNCNLNNDLDDSELKERLPSPRQMKIHRIKKDKSSNDNVKVFKFKIDSNEFNSRPMSPFKGKSADGDSSPREDSKSSAGKIAKNLNEGKVKKPRKQRREIKAGVDNFKEISSDKHLIKGDNDNGGQYDSLIIEENNGVGRNLNNSEVELENFERKISSMTIQLNVDSENNLGDTLNLRGNGCEVEGGGGSKNGKDFECSLNEEVEEKVKKDVEVEKCLAAVSDVLSSQSYYGSSGVTGTATVTGTVTGVGARVGVGGGAGSGSGIGYGGQREIEKRSRPNTSSGVLTRAFKHLTPKVNSRPRSSGGGFAWEVPDISGKVWSDDNSEEMKNKSKTPTTPTRMRRPRSANPQIYRKKSDPVLPVLESIIDLTFDTADMLDPFSVDCQAKGEDKNPPLELKHSVSDNLNGDDSGGKSKIKNKGKKSVSRKMKPDKLVSQDLSQKKPFLRSRSGKYSVLKVTKFKNKK